MYNELFSQLKYKKMIVEFPDAKYEVPVSVIAFNRALYYKDIYNIKIEESLKDTIEFFNNLTEIHEWAINDMNWSDLEPTAKKIEDIKRYDYQDIWSSGTCNCEFVQ